MQPTPQALERFARASNAFGLRLQRRLGAPPGNLVLSPASLSLALAMAWSGARGQTAAQMQQVLGFEDSQTEVGRAAGALARQLQKPGQPVGLRLANRLFGGTGYPFEPDFLEALRLDHDAALEPLDYARDPEAARLTINHWVEAQTASHIRELIPPRALGDDTRLVLVNALHFLGPWLEPFVDAATRPAPFQTPSGTHKEVPTMRQTEWLGFARLDGCKAVELLYEGGAMSMLLVLPDRIDGLDEAERALDSAGIEGTVRALQSQMVRVSLPRFRLEPSASLAVGEQLQAMGMTLAFDRLRADFSGMARPPDPDDRLFLAEVFHKGFIRVDEQGTEAAAATAVVALRAGGAARMEIAEFKADHPFLFFVRERSSGLVLFSGRVNDP